jgi:hypothetical protein
MSKSYKRKRYTIRRNGKKGSVSVLWSPLDRRWFEGSLYGPLGRYVILEHTNKTYTHFFRNPFAQPLLQNGGKP